jgi:hypothetical protein
MVTSVSFGLLMRIAALTLILWLCVGITEAQFRVTGIVLDEDSKEPLIGVTIQDTLSSAFAISDLEGRFELRAKTRVVLKFDYIGYESVVVDTTLRGNINLDISMSSGVMLQETLITAQQARIRENVTKTQMGKIEVPIEQMRSLPVFLGEMDILKSIQLLPGIQSGNEASAGFYVRGGGSDQNLVLYDGVPVYNPFHAAGFVSVFNMDVIKDVDVYKGGFPAHLGGRISSVIDVSVKSGDMQKWSGNGGIGIVTSRMTAQGPIIKDKLSMMLSARAFYSYSLMRMFFPADRKEELPVYYFYDLNGKLDYKINDKQKLAVSVYSGADRIAFADNQVEDSARYNIPWKNHLATAHWTYTPSSKLITKVQAYYSRYDFSFGFENTLAEYELNSGIQDAVLLSDTRWFINAKQTLQWGAEAGWHRYLPNISDNDIDNVVQDSIPVRNPAITSYTTALYLRHEWNPSTRWGFNYGLRLPMFFSEKSFYINPEPRATIKYQYSPDASFKVAYTLMTQTVHMLSASTTSTPLDLWIPSSDTIRPQISHQVSAGWFRNFKDDMFESNVEVFYKKLRNQIEYREGESIFQADDFRDVITFGEGWSTGAEFLVRKRYGRFNGFAAYTLSWSKRQFELLNLGRPFNAKYDRRHDFSLALNYQFNDSWALSGLFVFASGNSLTLPQGRFFIPGQNFTDSSFYLDFSKNNYRLRPYHRLDLGLQYRKEKAKITNEFRLDIYNVYSQLNPFFIVLTRAEDPKTNRTRIFVREYSILPIVPSLSYNIYIK